jgi:hypothetical protein
MVQKYILYQEVLVLALDDLTVGAGVGVGVVILDVEFIGAEIAGAGAGTGTAAGVGADTVGAATPLSLGEGWADTSAEAESLFTLFSKLGKAGLLWTFPLLTFSFAASWSSLVWSFPRMTSTAIAARRTLIAKTKIFTLCFLIFSSMEVA